MTGAERSKDVGPQIDHLDPEVREQFDRLVITGATIMVKRDEAPEDLSLRDIVEYLLHSSVTITLDTYSHAIPGLQRDAAERVAALIPGLSGGGA